MNELATLQAMGLEIPSPTYLFGALLFGILGYAAYRYGKKLKADNIKWLGVTLMLYPYLVSETWVLYAVGAGLCATVFYLRPHPEK